MRAHHALVPALVHGRHQHAVLRGAHRGQSGPLLLEAVGRRVGRGHVQCHQSVFGLVRHVPRAGLDHHGSAQGLEGGPSLVSRAAQPVRNDRDVLRVQQGQTLRLVQQTALRREHWRRLRRPARLRLPQQGRMRDDLRQHTEGLVLVGEGGHASAPERCRHRLLPSRHGDRLAAVARERGGVAREGLDVVAGAGHRDVDEHQVGGRVAGDHGQHITEEAAVGQQRRRDVDGVGGGGKTWQALGQFLSRAVGQRCQRQVQGLAGVSRHDAAGARVAHHDQSTPLGSPPLQIAFGRQGQRMRIAYAPDPVAPQERLHNAVFVGQRPRVRRRRSLAAGRMASLDRHNRQVAASGVSGGLRQQGGIGDALHVQQQQPNARIVRHSPGQVGDAHVGLVAGRVHVAHPQASAAHEAVGHRADAATLAHDADRAIHRLDLGEEGRKTRHRAAAEVRQALRVRPDQAHAAGPGGGDHAILDGPPGRPGLTEAGGDHNGATHAACRAVLHCRQRLLPGDDDQGHLGHLRQRSEAGVAGQALQLGAARVDRVQRARVPQALHVRDGPAADLVRVFGGADDGDGARRQRRGKQVCHVNGLWVRSLNRGA